MQMKLLRDTSVDFDIIDQPLSDFVYPTDTGKKWD
jgi:hypothetical protein